MSKESKGFDIPSQSIVKAEPVEGSKAWMKQISEEHGDTAPQKLEKRREKMSVFAKLQEDHYKDLQMQKKSFIATMVKAEAEAKRKLSTFQEGTPDFQKWTNQIEAIKANRAAQEQTYGLLIQQAMFQAASVEGLCLIVDSLTLRSKAKSKSGKVGMLRFSNALYALDSADYAVKGYNRLRKLFDLLAAAFPQAMLSLKDDEDEEQDDPSEYEDDDVMTEEDRKKVERELKGEADL